MAFSKRKESPIGGTQLLYDRYHDTRVESSPVEELNKISNLQLRCKIDYNHSQWLLMLKGLQGEYGEAQRRNQLDRT